MQKAKAAAAKAKAYEEGKEQECRDRVQRMQVVLRRKLLKAERAISDVVEQQQVLQKMGEALQRKNGDVQECIVCRDAAPSFMLIPCGHVCYTLNSLKMVMQGTV